MMADRSASASSVTSARALAAESVISSIDLALRQELGGDIADFLTSQKPNDKLNTNNKHKQHYNTSQQARQSSQNQHPQLTRKDQIHSPRYQHQQIPQQPHQQQQLSANNPQERMTTSSASPLNDDVRSQSQRQQQHYQLVVKNPNDPNSSKQLVCINPTPSPAPGSVEYVEGRGGMHQAPRFLTHIIDYAERREGESIHFEASLSPIGDPDLKVEWFFNGRPHVTGSRFHTLHDFGFVVLHIDWLYSRDTGEYICRAKNKFGSATTRAYLKVSPDRNIIFESQLEDPTSIERLIEMEASWNIKPEVDDSTPTMTRAAPRFILEPSACAAFEGSCARFSCRITGHPRPRITWLVNGQPVVTGSRYKLTFDGMHHLTMPKCQLSDEGDVEVVAQNALGECRHKTQLRMKRKVDDYRSVLKNSPNPWYDQNLKLQRKLQRASIDVTDDEYFAQMAQKFKHVLGDEPISDNGGNKDSNEVTNVDKNILTIQRQFPPTNNSNQLQQIVGYMDTATPDVNLLAGSSKSPFAASFSKANGESASQHFDDGSKIKSDSQQNAANANRQTFGMPHGDLHPATAPKTKVLAPPPSTIKRALRDKDAIRLPEASFHIDDSVRRRRDEEQRLQQQFDLTDRKDNILAAQHQHRQDERDARELYNQQQALIDSQRRSRQQLELADEAERQRLEQQHFESELELVEEQMYQDYLKQQQQQYQQKLIQQQQLHKAERPRQQPQDQITYELMPDGSQSTESHYQRFKPHQHQETSRPNWQDSGQSKQQQLKQQQQEQQAKIQHLQRQREDQLARLQVSEAEMRQLQEEAEAEEEALLELYQRAQLNDAKQTVEVQRQLRRNQKLLSSPQTSQQQATTTATSESNKQQQKLPAQGKLELTRQSESPARFAPSPSPESRVRGKETRSNLRKQTQRQKQGNTNIRREIIETEVVETQHEGLTRDNVLRGRSASVERQMSPAFGYAPGQGNATQISGLDDMQDIDVDTLEAPEFVDKIQPCRAFDGDEAVFECRFSGVPTPAITWLKDDKPLKSSNLYKITTDLALMTSQLIIKRVTRDYSESVLCVRAENVAGSAKSSANLLVEPHPMPGQWPSGVGLKVGPAGASTASASNSTTLLHSSNLQPANVELMESDDGDEFEIGCGAVTSSRTRTLSAAETAKIICASPDGSMAPAFLHTLQDLRGVHGELVRLDVRVVGSKPVDVRWLKDGVRVRVDKGHKMVLEGDMYTLLILECNKATDGGRYECVVSNKVGEARCCAKLDIVDNDDDHHRAAGSQQGQRSSSQSAGSKQKKPPHFHRYNPLMTTTQTNSADSTSPVPQAGLGNQGVIPKLIKRLENVEVVERRPVTLRCIISSFPAVQVSWYKGTQLIKPSKFFNIFKDNDETHCLRLVEAFAEDQGEYRCVAKTPDGNAMIETCAFVTVLENEEQLRLYQQATNRSPTPFKH